MPSESESIRRRLREAGVAPRAIDAVWPEWWSAEAESSLSATTELKYTIARRLGFSPRSLFEDAPRFLWKDTAKFKNLGAQSEQELAILASFGMAVARCVLPASPKPNESVPGFTAGELRSSILASSAFVALSDLLAFAWAFGIPVLQLQLFPLAQKRMHAITVRDQDRYVVLIGRASRFPAQVAYDVAHELGHVMMQHLAASTVLVEAEDPLRISEPDDEERSADAFALELLTGDPQPEIASSRANYTATELASAATEASVDQRADPAILALCLGHATGNWRQTFGALKMIPPGEVNVGRDLNALAASQLDWSLLSLENRDFLLKVLGEPDAASGRR